MVERKPDKIIGTVSQKKRVGDTVYSVTKFYNFSENNKGDRHLFFGILSVVVALLLILRVGGVVLGLNTNFTFTSLLDALSRINTIDTEWISTLGTYTTIHTSSKLLNNLVGFFVSVIQVACWVSVSSLNLIHILVNLIGIAFGVSI